MASPSVLIVGAGMVGVSCALALQASGWRVSLVDRRAPGEETSHGNAGVIACSSLIPFNHPRLWRMLPALLTNTSVGFRYAPWYLGRNFIWGARFLAHSRQAQFDMTTQALDALIRTSLNEHKRLRQEAAVSDRYRDTGWIMGYRTEQGFAATAWQRRCLQAFDVGMEEWDSNTLRAHEPAIADVFARSIWVRDALSVDTPSEVVKAFAQLFIARGGSLFRAEVPTAQVLQSSPQHRRCWQTSVGAYDHLVIALGPWSAAFLGSLGIRVPMAFERGYHQHFTLQNKGILNRPLYDVSGGYVASPMKDGIRVTTGVELNALNAPSELAQLAATTAAVREALALGEPTLSQPWRGARPTLPDSRPVIGASTRYENLWLAFGHQHIGFSTGPGTGALLAALMTGAKTPFNPSPFAAVRFGL